MNCQLLQGDALEVPRSLPSESVNCCITSPPYFGLRDYGAEGQLGLETTPKAYISTLVAVFGEVRRVLSEDGTLWLVIGDSYAANRGYQVPDSKWSDVGNSKKSKVPDGSKPKDLIGIPWMAAFALRDDGWFLRCDIVWCLSGGTWVYVKSQKGVMPMTIKDMARLNPATVKLWNGEKWTQLLGVSKSPRCGSELTLTLRSGERISCTPTHKFPTRRGLLEASAICVGDVLETCRLPEPESVKDCLIGEDAAWFAGLYIAEGSRSEDTIQIAGHAKQTDRWERVKRIGGAKLALDFDAAEEDSGDV